MAITEITKNNLIINKLTKSLYDSTTKSANETYFINDDGLAVAVDKLSNLQDVNINDVKNNQVLRYNSITGKWNNATGSGGDAFDDFITKVSVGSLPAGTVVSGKTAVEVLKMILGNPDLAPYAGLSIEPSTTLYELYRDTVNNLKIICVYRKTDSNLKSFNLKVNNTEVLNKEVTVDGSTEYIYTSPITNNTTITLTVYDSDVNPPKPGTAIKTITFVNASYYGTADNLTKVLFTSKNQKLNYTFINNKAVFKYPKSYGALTSIKDDNNIEYITTFNVTEVTEVVEGNNVVYYVYEQKEPTTISNFNFTFA